MAERGALKVKGGLTVSLARATIGKSQMPIGAESLALRAVSARAEGGGKYRIRTI